MKQDKPPENTEVFLRQKLTTIRRFLWFRKSETVKKRRSAMAFGPIMRLDVPQEDTEGLTVELAPLSKDTVGAFVENGGMQRYTVTRYLGQQSTPVLEDELEWFEKTRTSESSVNWGVWVVEKGTRKLIGTTSLALIEYGPTGFKQATSGVLIFDPNFWGKGIASSIHKARTWFAFTKLGLTRIKSAVINGNVGSRRALEKSGYNFVYTERNVSFAGGQLHHQENLECLNPLEPFWNNWWGEDTPTDASMKARQVTFAALAWAEKNVTLL